MSVGKHEALECPAEIQAYITAIFGVNHFGGPNFRIIWGQTETMDVLSSDGRSYVRKYIGHGEPCWIIQRWRPPELFGTPESYYQATADPETGLALLGEFPEFGMYETVTPLKHVEYNADTKELEIKTIPMDWEVIERAIPLLEAAENMTEAEKQAALDERERRENAETVAYIADRLYDELPTFYGPTSHAAISNRTALITRKMDELDKIWRRLGIRRPSRGFYQGQL